MPPFDPLEQEMRRNKRRGKMDLKGAIFEEYKRNANKFVMLGGNVELTLFGSPLYMDFVSSYTTLKLSLANIFFWVFVEIISNFAYTPSLKTSQRTTTMPFFFLCARAHIELY